MEMLMLRINRAHSNNPPVHYSVYAAFCRLAQQRHLGTLKRSLFKATMQDMVRDVHGLALRRDVPDALGKQQEAWKGVKLIETETLAA
jgi:hypothetical protein